MEKIKNNKFLILIFICTIFIIILPNLNSNLLIGDDYTFHLARIQSMADSIKSGLFPVKINSTLANSFGYGASLFYPDLFLYFPSLIMAIFNISLITS